MYYAVKKGRIPGIYENKEEALAQTFQFPFNEMRTFTKREQAEKYMNKVSNIFYVVKRGRVPGIYTSKEELSLQVRDFPNPFVKTFKNEQLAIEFFNKDTNEVLKIQEEKEILRRIQAEKSREEYRQKIESYLENGISTHGNNVCFIDLEANEGKGISIGAIVYSVQENKILDTYYSLMRYDSFEKMDSYCEKIHHITTEDILKARKSDEVMEEFISFINKYDVVDIFSWGNSDKLFLKKSLTNVSLMDKISPIRNVQTFISLVTKDILVNKTWSLQNMKKFYELEGDVVHDALSDARDLAKVFVCFQNKKAINESRVLEHSR